MMRERGGIVQISGVDSDLTAAQAFYLVTCWLSEDLGLPLETLGLTSDEGIVRARRD